MRDEREVGIVTAAEERAARSLADAIEGGDGAGADAEALAAVRLLAALRGIPADDLAARRGALAAEAALRAAVRRRHAVRLLAPLAAALVLAAGLAGGRRVPPIRRVADEVLAERQAEARAAVAGLASTSSSFRAARSEALLADLAASRFDTYRRERAAATEAAATSPSPSGTPSGGRS